MISVEEARRSVLRYASPRPSARVPLDAALGLVLADDLRSDIDSPPHDKSLVDGFALQSTDIRNGLRQFSVIEEVMAGELPTRPVASGEATRIMTGAPIPKGSDAVVMVEKSSPVRSNDTNQLVEIQEHNAVSGQNIMRRGASMCRGDSILAAGRSIRPIEIGMLAEIGCTQVPVIPQPRVAVLATGDELVQPESTPQPGQIRNSNGPMLEALARRAGAVPVPLGIARDSREHLAELVKQGLEADILVLSGGVSAGVLDLVPGVLTEAGVKKVFHRVNLKPGKPLWFGVAGDEGHYRHVFGLPGNPVSSLVCFELFVRSAIAHLAGSQCLPAPIPAMLARNHTQRGDRPTYFPARLADDKSAVSLLEWKGSADLRTLVDANCLCYFPAGFKEYAAGDDVEVVLL